MGNNKSRHITQSNMDQWISILGFSFPRNEFEESLFNKLYANFKHELSGKELDPQKLIKELEKEEENIKSINNNSNWKMAARNFDDSNLPTHILDKMKKNHNDKT